MRSVSRYLAVLAFLVAGQGCKASSSEPAPQSKPIVAPTEQEMMAQVATGSGASAGSDHPLVPTTDIRRMVSVLQREAANRPKAGVTAEAVFDELEAKANIKLEKRQQYLGAPGHAAFCAGGDTNDKLHVVLCEYTDDKTASESMQTLDKSFPIKGVHRVEHKAAVLTVRANDANDARVERATQAFEAM